MIEKKLNDYMHGFIVDICNNIGPREAGSKQEELAGNKIEEELKKFCDETHQEKFICSPTAFLGFVRYGALMALISVIFYWLSLLVDLGWLQIDNIFSLIFIVIAVILLGITVPYFIFEIIRYFEFYDFMFPKKESKNVIGTINPTDKVKNTIIFSAHHDSAYEFNLFYYLKRIGQMMINIGLLEVFLLFFLVVLKLIFYFLPIDITMIFFGFGIVFLTLLPVAFLFMFFHTYNPVLGAFDNLSGVVILLGIGKYLYENKNNEKIFPKQTKIHLVSFAAEEAGLRGSKRYVKAHYDELKENGTIIVNMDGIAKTEKLLIISKEPFIGAKYDPEIYNPILKIASDLKLNIKTGPLSFGATDGAAFVRKGIPAVTISGLDLKEELPPFYHTREDTPEVVDKESLGQVLEICLNYIKLIDSSN